MGFNRIATDCRYYQMADEKNKELMAKREAELCATYAGEALQDKLRELYAQAETARNKIVDRLRTDIASALETVAKPAQDYISGGAFTADQAALVDIISRGGYSRAELDAVWSANKGNYTVLKALANAYKANGEDAPDYGAGLLEQIAAFKEMAQAIFDPLVNHNGLQFALMVEDVENAAIDLSARYDAIGLASGYNAPELRPERVPTYSAGEFVAAEQQFMA